MLAERSAAVLAPPLTSARCQAARAALGWSALTLSLAAKVPIVDLVLFERGHRLPTPRALAALRLALEAAGVEFIDQDGEGPGVRLKGPET